MLIGLIQSKWNLMISRVKDKCVGWDVGVCSQWEGNDQEMGVSISHPLPVCLEFTVPTSAFPGLLFYYQRQLFLVLQTPGAETIPSFLICEP